MYHLTDSAFTQNNDQLPHRSYNNLFTQYRHSVIHMHARIGGELALTLWRTHQGKTKEDEDFEHLHHSENWHSPCEEHTKERPKKTRTLSIFIILLMLLVCDNPTDVRILTVSSTSPLSRFLVVGKWMSCTQQFWQESLVMRVSWCCCCCSCFHERAHKMCLVL